MNKKIMIVANDTSYIYKLRKDILEKILIEGYNLVVVSSKANYVSEIEDLGIKIIDLNISRHGKNPFSDLVLYKKIRTILRDEQPNIVFTYNIKPNVYFGRACRIYKIPFVPNITGLGGALLNPGLVKKISTLLYKVGMKGASTVFFQNEFNKDFFINNGIISKSKDYTILPGSGINLEKNVYKNYPIDDSKIIFITIARIMKDKGISELLDAAVSIKQKYLNVEFQLVGDYDDIGYKDRIEKLDKDGIIMYLGHRKDVNRLIERSYCMIHPSYHEGLSNVLLEAGATGRPVIASDVPGCKETFVDGKTGLSVKPCDSNDLIRKIEEFISIPYEKKVEMGKANRSYVEKNFDRRIVVEKYLECIEKFAK